MAYTHLTIKELSWIEPHFDTGFKPYKITIKIGQSNQSVYNVVTFVKEERIVVEYFDRYQRNISKLSANEKTFIKKKIQYIKDKASEDWTLDVIIDRSEKDLAYSMRTLYKRI